MRVSNLLLILGVAVSFSCAESASSVFSVGGNQPKSYGGEAVVAAGVHDSRENALEYISIENALESFREDREFLELKASTTAYSLDRRQRKTSRKPTSSHSFLFPTWSYCPR
jgi:hypothetical protein